MQTAKIINEELKVELEISTLTYEFLGQYDKNGIFLGNNRQWVHQYVIKYQNQYPEFNLPNEINENGWYFLNRKETFEDLDLRIDLFLTYLKEMRSQELNYDLAFVSHGWFMGYFHCNLERLVHRIIDSTNKSNEL